MGLLRIIRIGTWAAVLVAAPLAVALAFGWWQVDGPGRQAAPMPAIGGPFALTDQAGRAVTERSLAGRPFLVFFGFTQCPDVCPTTLFETSEALKALGAEGERIQVLFVSVDPERDTREILALYLQSFDPRIIGATGPQGAVDAMVQAYRATYRKVPTEGGGYTIDHTATMFMMDSAGRFVGTLDYHEARETVLAKLKRLAGL